MARQYAGGLPDLKESMAELTEAQEKQPEEWFTYHKPTAAQVPKYDAINAAAKAFARVVLENTPSSADQSATIRLIRLARMTANASIALEPSPDAI